MMRPTLSWRQDSNLRGLSPLGYKASLFNHSSTPAFFSCPICQRTFSFAVHSGIEPEPLVRQTNILTFRPMDYKKTLPRISCCLGGLLTILFLFFNRQQSCLPCKHEEYRQSCSVGLGVQVNSAVCFFSGYMFFLISLLVNIQIFFGLNKYFDCLSKKRFKKDKLKMIFYLQCCTNNV